MDRGLSFVGEQLSTDDVPSSLADGPVYDGYLLVTTNASLWTRYDTARMLLKKKLKKKRRTKEGGGLTLEN